MQQMPSYIYPAVNIPLCKGVVDNIQIRDFLSRWFPYQIESTVEAAVWFYILSPIEPNCLD